MQMPGWLRRHGDALIAVALATGSVVELSTARLGGDPRALPCAVAASLAMAFRRRSPLGVFVVVLALFTGIEHWAPVFGSDGVSSAALFILNLYSLGANAVGVEAALGVVGVLLAIAGIASNDGDLSAGGIFFYVLFCGLPWGAGVVIRLRIVRVRELSQANAALQEEARRAVAEERARIARELHDVVSHAIAVTVLQARGAGKLVGRDDEQVRRALAAIEQTNTSALADMRRLLSLLRSEEGGSGREAPAPTLDRLDHLVDQVRGSGVPVDLRVTGEPLPVPPGLDLSAYRIVQEALTNVLKHGGAGATAHVEVHYGAEDLDVVVRSSGRATEHSGDTVGHGLIGIRERVSVAGGSVEAGPVGDGYRVRARLPYLPRSGATTGDPATSRTHPAPAVP